MITEDINATVNTVDTSMYNYLASSINSTAISGAWFDTPKIDVLEKKVDQLTKKPDVRPDTTTKLDIKNGSIRVKHYNDGFFESERTVMPDIKDVTVYNNKTVIVTFADNTKTVAVLDAEDKFNLEQGISICITKKLLGKDGGAVYNKLINRAFKVKAQNEKAVEEAMKAKEEEERRRELALARHKKKLAKKREAAIEIQKEAYIRAIEHLNSGIEVAK